MGGGSVGCLVLIRRPAFLQRQPVAVSKWVVRLVSLASLQSYRRNGNTWYEHTGERP